MNNLRWSDAIAVSTCREKVVTAVIFNVVLVCFWTYFLTIAATPVSMALIFSLSIGIAYAMIVFLKCDELSLIGRLFVVEIVYYAICFGVYYLATGELCPIGLMPLHLIFLTLIAFPIVVPIFVYLGILIYQHRKRALQGKYGFMILVWLVPYLLLGMYWFFARFEP